MQAPYVAGSPGWWINYITLIEHLKKLIETDGPAIVSVSDLDAGGHVIIVNEINENGVRIREPYHGWEITVMVDSLFKRYAFTGEAIQIAGRVWQRCHPSNLHTNRA